jgi:hypothetical protein
MGHCIFVEQFVHTDTWANIKIDDGKMSILSSPMSQGRYYLIIKALLNFFSGFWLR